MRKLSILVTGCGSGFGRVLAPALRDDGHFVTAHVRRQSQAVGLTGVAVATLDLLAEDPELLVQRHGPFDVVINNAGLGLRRALEDSADQLRDVLQVNLHAPLRLSAAALPHMRAQGFGKVLNVTSLSAFAGLAGDSVYAASKAALHRASEALRYEVERFGIHVCSLVPGAYATGLTDGLEQQAPEASAYRFLYQGTVDRPTANPQELVAVVRRVLSEDNPPFLQPVGEQAQAVLERLGVLNERQRESYLRALQEHLV